MEAGDDLAEFAIDFLLTGRGSARRLVRVMAEHWPDRSALSLPYALAAAASGIGQVLKGAEVGQLSQEAWCMAGLVGVDLFVAQSNGLPHLTNRDLLAFWHSHDRFFLDD